MKRMFVCLLMVMSCLLYSELFVRGEESAWFEERMGTEQYTDKYNFVYSVVSVCADREVGSNNHIRKNTLIVDWFYSLGSKGLEAYDALTTYPFTADIKTINKAMLQSKEYRKMMSTFLSNTDLFIEGTTSTYGRGDKGKNLILVYILLANEYTQSQWAGL